MTKCIVRWVFLAFLGSIVLSCSNTEEPGNKPVELPNGVESLILEDSLKENIEELPEFNEVADTTIKIFNASIKDTTIKLSHLIDTSNYEIFMDIHVDTNQYQEYYRDWEREVVRSNYTEIRLLTVSNYGDTTVNKSIDLHDLIGDYSYRMYDIAISSERTVKKEIDGEFLSEWFLKSTLIEVDQLEIIVSFSLEQPSAEMAIETCEIKKRYNIVTGKEYAELAFYSNY